MNIYFTVILFLFFLCSEGNAQLVVAPNSNTNMLVNEFLGAGISLSGTPTKFCNSNGTGFFSNGHSTSCPLDSGIILSTGYASFLDRTATFTASAGLNFGMNDPDLLTLNPQSNTDICYLQFDFIPTHDSLVFDYVFGSEEYLEWVGSVFNDVFGFFVTGPNPQGGTYNNTNLALVPTSSSIVSINSINDVSNSGYYINNYPTGAVSGINDPNFTLDGFTTKMEIGLSVVPNASYTIKMVVGDVSDPLWDSYVLLHSRSFRSFSATTLAIQLLSFTGKETNDGILLEWETGQEIEHRGFEIEHSLDGVYWDKIGDIEGVGNSQTVNAYSLLHQDNLQRWNYYRLAIIDQAGNTVYSDVLAVECKKDNNGFNLFPTYVSKSNRIITIETKDLSSEDCTLTIYDILGKEVLAKKLANRREEIDISSLKQGCYLGTFGTVGLRKTIQFFVE